MEKASNTENFDSARVNKQCCDIQDFPARHLPIMNDLRNFDEIWLVEKEAIFPSRLSVAEWKPGYKKLRALR